MTATGLFPETGSPVEGRVMSNAAALVVPPEIAARVAELVDQDLSAQLQRDPISAARASHHAGERLSDALLRQCKWRGIDPAPYLAQIEADGLA